MPKNRKAKAKKPKTIPYAKGFKKPNEKDKLNAIRKSRSEKEIEKEFRPIQELFKELEPPKTKYDWLAVYAETGQTCADYIRTSPWLKKPPIKWAKLNPYDSEGSTICEKYPKAFVYILPIGSLEFGNLNAIRELVKYARLFYNIPIKIMDPFEVISDNKKEEIRWRSENGEEIKIKSRFHKKKKRFQFLIDSCLREISCRMPPDAFFVIGLTMDELYAAKSDLFVSGMASGVYRSAIFSLKRYDPALKFCEEFWYKYDEEPYDSEERWRVLLKRSCTLLVHEMGHLLGIGHCIYYDCCMNGSGHLEEDIRQSMHLCPVDLRKLQILCGIDVIQRYEKLLNFFREFKFKEEEEWIRKRLEQLSR